MSCGEACAFQSVQHGVAKMSELEHQTVDELNEGICVDCRTVIANALSLGTKPALCPNCNDIIDEMLKRMRCDAEATRH
jgi:hypothetical protein